MSTPNSAKKGQSIEGAEEIIERFGGIRPMAKKMGVAVTTVQGWKKRDTIPANRRASVIESAIDNDIDLSDILPDAIEEAMPSFVTKPAPDEMENVSSLESAKPDTVTTDEQGSAGLIANENVRAYEADIEREKDFYASQAPDSSPASGSSQSAYASSEIRTPKRDELDEKLKKKSKNSGGAAGWIIGGLLLIAITGGAYIFLTSEPSEPLAYEAEQTEEGFFSTLIPADLDARIKALQEKTGLTQENIDKAVNTAKSISNDVLDGTGTTAEKAEKLNAHVKDLTGVDLVEYFSLQNFQSMLMNLESTARGETLMNRSVAELSAVLSTVQENPDSFSIDEQLAMAQIHMPAISQTMGNVPAEDLKAAGLLLALTQFRKSLNRGNENFADDLQVLKILVGDANPELSAAIDRLAPYSEQGILTPDGLQSEFKTLAGEAVVASIKGEDVSFSERVKGRIGEVMQVEKDGELIVGNDTQIKVDKAQSLLEQGEIGAAIELVEQLDGPAADILKPWLSQAKATQSAQSLKGIINQAMTGDAVSALGLGKGRLVRDKTGATNVYIPR